MTLYQCGFSASGKSEYSTSKDIASASPVPVSEKRLQKAFSGGWGFGLASSDAGGLYVWGVNAATLLGQQGEMGGVKYRQGSSHD